MEFDNPLKNYLENESVEEFNALAYEKDIPECSRILHLKDACPICNSDIKGNQDSGYFCEECNMIFAHNSIVLINKD